METKEHTMERIFIAADLFLLHIKGKYTPYRLVNGHGVPTRGYNKKGQLCWRTYKSVDEAKANLLG